LEKYNEEFNLALFITGKKNEPNWTSKDEDASFYQLKSYLENLFSRMGIMVDSLRVEPITEKKDLYAGGLLYSHNGIAMAELAFIHPNLRKNFDIRNEVFYAGIYWDRLLKIRGYYKITLADLPRFPEVRRDLALLLDESIAFAQIRELAFKTESKLLKRINLFDVYEGEQIEQNKKSYAVSFYIQDTESTLTDERIDQIMTRLMDTYKKELGAEIR